MQQIYRRAPHVEVRLLDYTEKYKIHLLSFDIATSYYTLEISTHIRDNT